MQTWFIAAAFAVLPIIGVAHAEGTAPTVTIDAGRLTGTTQGEADVFLGIPYAAAPIGARRWMPPAPVAAWKDSRPANAYGATCPQPKLAMMGATTQSEDCLFINVWAPKGAASSTKKLPVMVWIHGGAYFLGSGNIADTSAFTRDGVIVVSMNYRLGRLGFFAHPALTAEAPQGALGNYGLMDQVSA
ncbi:MAG: carboxylesterase family protein, partial [Steroidobacteraceae bacterium]